MILDHLQIAENIVTITYAGLIGAIALGSALAFGLGGRDVAARLLEGAYEQGRQHKEEFKRDLDQGLSRAKAEAESMRESTGEPEPRRGRTPAHPTVPVTSTPVSRPMGDAVEPAYESAYEQTEESR